MTAPTPGRLRTHLHQDDPDNGPDHRGQYRCLCGLPKDNAVHKLPRRSEEEFAEEARRMGER